MDERAQTEAVARATAGDERAFAGLVERHQRELHVHCYRMLGSFDEAQDLVQETFLRAWQSREGFRGGSQFRAWLYRIATNACLDFLARHPRPRLAGSSRDRASQNQRSGPPPPAAVPWLQPYPDRLLEEIPSGQAEPDAVYFAKETIELAFLAAVQYLTPRQRATLIMRDVLGWSAKETAELLGASVASVNSGLQRARLTMRTHLPEHRLDWGPSPGAGDRERAAVERYMDALRRADDDAVASVLREDARVGHQGGSGGHTGAEPVWYEGREAIVRAWAPILHGPGAQDLRLVPTRANLGPAVATYVSAPGASDFRAFALAVLDVRDGLVAEVTVFGSKVFAAFGLPDAL
ncbi:RNA polymerase subunit sigma-70 [Actinomadura chibensis]|uniref:RNA polymerase sigma factor n=1 Tax=Actinomadura chibensis TaxID=392828 RepID=A0A5D0NBT9_9ACTN|nr:RNA polymerase subunit sigma-70 [Actinomadura chibensis]TYB41852.1 sigma-70 family RNA polymerase sigma factor [Actinomadura chibensis]